MPKNRPHSDQSARAKKRRAEQLRRNYVASIKDLNIPGYSPPSEDEKNDRFRVAMIQGMGEILGRLNMLATLAEAQLRVSLGADRAELKERMGIEFLEDVPKEEQLDYGQEHAGDGDSGITSDAEYGDDGDPTKFPAPTDSAGTEHDPALD